MLKTTVQFQKNLFINNRNKKHRSFCPLFVDCGGHIGIPTTIKNLNLKGPPELSKPMQFQLGDPRSRFFLFQRRSCA